MTSHPWRAALTRWGDPLFRLALLLTNDRTSAERATIQAFTRSLATPSDDPEAALYAALVRTQPRRRHPFQRRVLSRPLERIAPLDRLLLGLWLLRDTDGARLLTISGLPADSLTPRLATAIALFLAPDDPVHTDAAAREEFELWLKRRLGLTPSSPVHTGAYDSLLKDDWQTALDTLRHTFLEAVGRQHLPQQCIEIIEADLLEPADEAEPRWWRRRAAWIGAVALILGLIWIVKPWDQGVQETATAPLTTKELVQETLDAWTTTPISGTLHRQVVAFNPRSPRAPLTTEIWLSAEHGQHRIEVRNGTTLVEWQIGDGKNRLDHAAEPAYTSCDWSFETGTLDRIARSYRVPVEQQIAARDARLLRGAYGQGYVALQQALKATDLRSYGTRVEGKTLLHVLGYTDRQAMPERKLLLWIDPAAKELHAVREVAEAGGQADTREIWRLRVSEEVSARVSVVPPSWSRPALTRDSLFDPGCPGLDPEHVVSLRTLINDGSWSWQQWYLPATLPPDVTRAALLTPSIVTPDAVIQDTRAVFIGSNRWFSLRTTPHNNSPPGTIERGPWRVLLNERGNRLSGSVCRYFGDARTGFCVPSIQIEARGWTQEELLTVIDSFELVDGQTWLEHKDRFLEPLPLTPEVQTTLEQSVAAIQKLKAQPIYSVVERTIRMSPNRPTWQDPYHVPLDQLFPERSTQEQWIAYANQQVAGFRDITRHPSGNVIAAQINDGQQDAIYNASQGTVWNSRENRVRYWIPIPQWSGEQFLRSLLANSAPITIAQDDAAWLLEQPRGQQHVPSGMIGSDQTLIEAFGAAAWVADLPRQRFVHRIWIDRNTYLPTRAASVHIDVEGRETVVMTATITTIRQVEALPDDTFVFPALPEDTIMFEIQPSGAIDLTADSFTFNAPDRTLIWSNASGLLLEENRPIFPLAYSPENRVERIQQALFSQIQDLDHTGFIRATTYDWPTPNERITIRQGPRSLLRHILRHQTALSDGRGMTWTMSKPLSAMIAGQQRAVWLLETNETPMLVFEVDDLLVHIHGPNAETLEREILPLLPKLEWADPQN